MIQIQMIARIKVNLNNVADIRKDIEEVEKKALEKIHQVISVVNQKDKRVKKKVEKKNLVTEKDLVIKIKIKRNDVMTLVKKRVGIREKTEDDV